MVMEIFNQKNLKCDMCGKDVQPGLQVGWVYFENKFPVIDNKEIRFMCSDCVEKVERNIPQKEKVVLVTIVYEDKNGKRGYRQLSGEEAEKWKEACDGQASFCYTHGMKFPDLKWEEVSFEKSIPSKW